MPDPTFSLRFPADLLEEVTADAKRSGASRTDWLVQAAREKLSRATRADEGTPKKGLAPGRGNPPTKAPPPAVCAHERTRLSQVAGKVLCEKCGAVLR